MTRTIGVVINPVAGLGGPAGLKGSDGLDVQTMARERGVQPRASSRAGSALAVIAAAHPGAHIVTAAGELGADEVSAAGLNPTVVYQAPARSNSADTAAAVSAFMAEGVELVLFVGGDGTARDVASAIPAEQAILGVPAGVKMYSSCFAVSPSAAGELAARWFAGERLPLAQREVLDVDEEQVRHGRVNPLLYALVQVPYVLGRTQSRKNATPASEAALVDAAARGMVASLDPSTVYLLGPGGTTLRMAKLMGIDKTPLGVDVVQGNSLLLADASERQLLELIESVDDPVKAVITIIGGQGFLLGRGNQQLSPAVLNALGREPLLVVATEEKLTALGGRPLLIDTGSVELDRSLTGYIHVITSERSASVYPVEAPETETQRK